jgi:NADH-quinone oxidoreductase subunit C
MSEEIVSSLKSKFPTSITNIISEDRHFSLTAKKEEFYQILSWLKDLGFDHLSDITCIDFIKDKEFEVIYHLWSHTRKLRGAVKVRILREAPSIRSIVDLWAGAQIHERENHEMFGINFDGNPDLSPLFLEDWEEIPPFRKDFDSREYVKKKYYGGK